MSARENRLKPVVGGFPERVSTRFLYQTMNSYSSGLATQIPLEIVNMINSPTGWLMTGKK